MSLTYLLESRPACCAAAGFAAVSFIGYIAAADADPHIAGAVKLAAAALFTATAAVFAVLRLRAARTGSDITGEKSIVAASGGTQMSGAARRRRLYASIAALLFACGAAAMLSHLHFGRPARLLEKYGAGTHAVTVAALDIERISAYDASYYVEVAAIDGEPVGGISRVYAMLEADYILDLELYKIYMLDGLTCAEPQYSTSAEAAYGASRGVMLTLHSAADPGGAPAAQGEGAVLRGFVRRINSAMAQRLTIGLGKDSGGLAACLLLGRWDSLTGTVSRDFRALGILHLLAISGEHLSILLGALEMLLRGINKYIRFAILAAGALLILALTGMSPSVARAALMSVLYYGAFILRRRADGLTSLFVATAIILAFSPAAAADIGLMMSLLSALGIITLGRELSARKKPRLRALAFVRENFINSLCATLFTLPVSWLMCGELALVSPVATLVFVLPVTALLYLTPLALILFGTPLFEPVGFATDALCVLVREMSQSLARPLSGTLISLRYPFVWVAFAASLAVLCILPHIKPVFGSGAGFFASGAVFAAVFAVSLGIWNLTEAGTSRVIYYSGGKNEMLVLNSQNASMICDISDGTYTPLKNAARLARSRFYAAGIDGYMLTHLHRRHVMQFMRLASRYFVRTLVLPSPQTEAERSVALALEKAANEYGAAVIYYDASKNSQVEMRALTLTLPARLYTKRSTHPVIAMYISGSGSELLYLGGGNGGVPDDRRVLLESWARGAKCIVFGAHSPAYYSVPDPASFALAELAVYPTPAVRDAYGIPEDSVSGVLTLEETGYDSIELKFSLEN